MGVEAAPEAAADPSVLRPMSLLLFADAGPARQPGTSGLTFSIGDFDLALSQLHAAGGFDSFALPGPAVHSGPLSIGELTAD